MNKRYLFRGKRTNNNKWEYGLLARYNPQFETANLIDGYELLIPVKTETVGQYTGLTDKNGKKIFEGDIVVTDKFIFGFKHPCFDKKIKSIGVVRLQCSRYGSRWAVYNNDVWGNEYFDQINCSYWEVTGNIHDNPELLEVE